MQQQESQLNDPFALERFVEAQKRVYEQALAELKRGRKESHWMWFIFPQLAGLGKSSTATFYAIRTLDEARAYLRHPVLGARLTECANTLLEIRGGSAFEIFGYPDDLKLRSSLTLFHRASESCSVFKRVLDRYYGGELDEQTLELLGE